MWVAAYAASMILTVVLVGGVAALLGDSAADVANRAWAVGLGSLALWAPAYVGIELLRKQYGSRDIRRDLGVTFTMSDLVGVVIGAGSQLVLVGIVTWPFTKVFPGSFSQNRVEQRAQDLLDGAKGAWIILLFIVVVVGAPLMEELVYRGVLQTSIARSTNAMAAWIIVAAWFAVIHMSLVELPGLFAFALVLGHQRRRTNRLGLCMVTHAAFNATGLLLLMGK
jgi:membrane protease YdiL (CAAX protease family)